MTTLEKIELLTYKGWRITLNKGEAMLSSPEGDVYNHCGCLTTAENFEKAYAKYLDKVHANYKYYRDLLVAYKEMEE